MSPIIILKGIFFIKEKECRICEVEFPVQQELGTRLILKKEFVGNDTSLLKVKKETPLLSHGKDKIFTFSNQ